MVRSLPSEDVRTTRREDYGKRRHASSARPGLSGQSDFLPKRGRHVLLFSNANSQTKRKNLIVRTSSDDGRIWSAGRVIYAGPAAYSDLVIQQNGNIGVLYEKDGYKRIVYAQFACEWLGEKK